MIDLVQPLLMVVIAIVNPVVLEWWLVEPSRTATAYTWMFVLTCGFTILLFAMANRRVFRGARTFAIAWLVTIPLQLMVLEFAVFYYQTYVLSEGGMVSPNGQGLHHGDHWLGWTPRAGATIESRSPGRFAVTYRIDEHGRRVGHGPAAAKLHVFGDSFTFGYGVEDDQTYAAVLQGRHLHGYQVLNHGVNGYGLEQMYLRMVRSGAELEPGDIVLFAPISAGLTRTFVDRRFLCGLAPLQTLPTVNASMLQGSDLKSKSCSTFEVFLGWSRLPIAGLANWILDWLHRDRVIDNANQVIELAARFAEERGAHFMLVFLARPAECVQRRHVFDIADVTWPHSSLLEACPRDRETIMSHWFAEEHHWTPAGHAWAAGLLAELIANQGRTFSAIDSTAVPSR